MTTHDDGYVTAETALALPSLVVAFFALLLLVLAAGDKLRCDDAAWEAARLLARGESANVASDVALRLAPAGARMVIEPGSSSGSDAAPGPGVVRVIVSARIGLPGSRLPALDLSGSAEVACEPGSPCPDSDQ